MIQYFARSVAASLPLGGSERMYSVTLCGERSPVLSRPIAFSASGDIWWASCLHKVVRKLNDAIFYMSLRRGEGLLIIMSLETGSQG